MPTPVPDATRAAAPPGGKRRLDAQTRREQILSRAAKLFERKAYSEVSTTEIAAAAGVGRPLVNHYFGNKRGLYLEVVRRFVFISPVAIARVPHEGSPLERIEATLDQSLALAERHRGMWLSTIIADDLGHDDELSQILREADDVAADHMIAAIGLDPPERHRAAVHALVVAYGGLVKSATRQWLDAGTLTRAQVRTLLVRSMFAIVDEVIPALD